MAKYSGVNYADTQSVPPELIEECLQRGSKDRMTDIFVLTADLASGDQIFMGGVIQEGAVLVDLELSCDALGGAGAVNVGWIAVSEQFPTGGGGDTLMASNPTGFLAAAPVSSAAVLKAHGSAYEGGGPGASTSSFWNVRITSPIQVVIADTVATSGATGKAIAIALDYIAL